MTISKKISIYSSVLITLVITSIIAYFIFMLPSLYVSYVSNQRLETMFEIQQRIEGGLTAQEIATTPLPDKSIQFATLKIPDADYTLSLSTNYSNSVITLEDADLQEGLDDIRSIIKNVRTLKTEDEMSSYFETLDFSKYETKFKDMLPLENQVSSYFTIDHQIFENQSLMWNAGETVFHPMHENSIVLESQSKAGDMLYTNYVAFLIHDDAIYLTAFSAMTPSLHELLPIIIQSLPMILSVALLFILFAASIFSKALVTPLKKLTYTTDQMRFKSYEKPLVDTASHDEISTLALALDTLYNDLNTSLQSLEQSNEELALKHEQQQVFLMSSSHQLKTPVTSSLLLIEGMIDKIGKYADTALYLPEVKMQLLSMREIINEILEVNQTIISKEQFTDISLSEMVSLILQQHSVQIETKQLHVSNSLGSEMIHSDPKFFYKILDNLIVNAIIYTPNSENIIIEHIEDGLKITNFGITIDETLLPKIFEPFVRVTSTTKGHGLGLYIVENYAQQLNITIEIKNNIATNAVETIILFDTTYTS